MTGKWRFLGLDEDTVPFHVIMNSNGRKKTHTFLLLDIYFLYIGSIDGTKRLTDLVQGIPCKINLLSFNPHSGSQFKTNQ